MGGKGLTRIRPGQGAGRLGALPPAPTCLTDAEKRRHRMSCSTRGRMWLLAGHRRLGSATPSDKLAAAAIPRRGNVLPDPRLCFCREYFSARTLHDDKLFFKEKKKSQMPAQEWSALFFSRSSHLLFWTLHYPSRGYIALDILGCV